MSVTSALRGLMAPHPRTLQLLRVVAVLAACSSVHGVSVAQALGHHAESPEPGGTADSTAQAPMLVPSGQAATAADTAPATAAAALPVQPVATSAFRLGALGLSTAWSPEYLGAAAHGWSGRPNFVLHWGRLTVSNGGTLASRSGEVNEGGLSADIFSMNRFSLRAALSLDQGRRSSDSAALRGLHDIPAHLRGRVQAAWRLHAQWEVLGVWRGDLSDRGTGTSAELVLLHEWRPEFLDHRRSRVSVGLASQWRDTRHANLVLGVTAEDAARTTYPAYRLNAGWTDARVFANWRRDLGGPWVAYGSFTWQTLLSEAAQSPVVQRPRSVAFSLGAGRRF